MRVDRYGWDSAEILLPVTLPREGCYGGAEMGAHFPQIIIIIFFKYFCYNKCCKNVFKYTKS